MSYPPWRDNGPSRPNGGRTWSRAARPRHAAPAGDPSVPRRDPRGRAGPGPGGVTRARPRRRRGPPRDEGHPRRASVTARGRGPAGGGRQPSDGRGAQPAAAGDASRRAGRAGPARPPRAAEPDRARARCAVGSGSAVIIASAVLGAVATIVTRSQPGLALGLFVLAGTVAAALTVEPRAGRLIFPVPALSYLVAALVRRRGVQPVREQDRARGRRGPVDRQRVLRHGAGHAAGHRADHGALVPVAPLRAGPARRGLAGRGRPLRAQARPARAGPLGPTAGASPGPPGRAASPGAPRIPTGQAGREGPQEGRREWARPGTLGAGSASRSRLAGPGPPRVRAGPRRSGPGAGSYSFSSGA